MAHSFLPIGRFSSQFCRCARSAGSYPKFGLACSVKSDRVCWIALIPPASLRRGAHRGPHKKGDFFEFLLLAAGDPNPSIQFAKLRIQLRVEE